MKVLILCFSAPVVFLLTVILYAKIYNSGAKGQRQEASCAAQGGSFGLAHEDQCIRKDVVILDAGN